MNIAVFSANELDTGNPLFIVKDEDGNQLYELRDKGVFPCGLLSVYANVQPLASREQIAQEIEASTLAYIHEDAIRLDNGTWPGLKVIAVEDAAAIARGEK